MSGSASFEIARTSALRDHLRTVVNDSLFDQKTPNDEGEKRKINGNDEQDGRYFLKYIHAPSTNKANVVAQRYFTRIPVFLAIG